MAPWTLYALDQAGLDEPGVALMMKVPGLAHDEGHDNDLGLMLIVVLIWRIQGDQVLPKWWYQPSLDLEMITGGIRVLW